MILNNKNNYNYNYNKNIIIIIIYIYIYIYIRMSYQQKYLKYKAKYLKLVHTMSGGANLAEIQKTTTNRALLKFGLPIPSPSPSPAVVPVVSNLTCKSKNINVEKSNCDNNNIKKNILYGLNEAYNTDCKDSAMKKRDELFALCNLSNTTSVTESIPIDIPQLDPKTIINRISSTFNNNLSRCKH
jgi:hypothetical protein